MKEIFWLEEGICGPFGGIDRTGFLMVYYLFRKYGTPFQAGLDQVRKVRPNALTALGWEEMARRVVR